jgi:NAD(P)-dependent dehydrogenase (short-subunit alcohol dehydrogenase family)
MCVKFGKDYITKSFVTTSGHAVERPIPGASFGVGGAGAMNAMTRNLAVDLAPIRANCVAPGLIHTEMIDVSFYAYSLSRNNNLVEIAGGPSSRDPRRVSRRLREKAPCGPRWNA